MNCRAFQRNLEDYLQGGLDFAGRFAIERHAQQCIRCGKELAGAQQLHQMLLAVKRVKAPLNFESSILNEIGMRKARGPFSIIRSFWIYGSEWPSWRNLILASSGLVALVFGIFFAFRRAAPDPPPPPSLVATEPAKEIDTPEKIDVKDEPVVNDVRSAALTQPVSTKAPETAEAAQPSGPEQEYFRDREVTDAGYVEYQVVGPDNRPLTIRLPKYRETSEDYFIRNVSH
jgi:hypothetical protein